MITGDVGHTDSRECQGWTEDEGDTVVLFIIRPPRTAGAGADGRELSDRRFLKPPCLRRITNNKASIL